MKPIRRRWTFRIFALLLALVLLEVAARVAVATLWEPGRADALTQVRGVVGRFASHPYLPYVLAPGLHRPESFHDSRGFRGDEIDDPQPAGTLRVACIGASTTYGFPRLVADAYPSRLREWLRAQELKAEVVNAGVMGWVSSEVLLNLQLRVLPLEPDVVVAYLGRNEVFPQGWNGFRDDYAHFRRADYRIESANAGYKRLFRWSQLAMVLCTWRVEESGGRFGWSGREQNPVYGSVDFGRQPSIGEFITNLEDARRREPFRRNLEAMAALCESRGARFVLAPEAVRPEKFGSGYIDQDPRVNGPFGMAVRANHEIMTAVANARNLTIVETRAIADTASFFDMDDCHLTAAGYSRLAEIVGDAVVRLLPQPR
jgi:lysophospholipase L1-like esterase